MEPIKNMFEMIIRMYRMDVRDRHGKLWLPIFGYDSQVEAYAPATEAIDRVNAYLLEEIRG